MTCEELIRQNVNDSRGGYLPDEVKDLIRKAYDAGAEESRLDAVRKLSG